MTKEEFVKIFKEETNLKDDAVISSYWENSFAYEFDEWLLRRQLRWVDQIARFLLKLFKACKI